MDSMTLGARIQRARKSQGLTVDELADFSGVNRALIYRIEAGNTCQIETLRRLAISLSVTTDSLLGLAPAEPEVSDDPPAANTPKAGRTANR